MQLLKDKIVKEGKILPGNIVKVDGFLNHRIDIDMMEEICSIMAHGAGAMTKRIFPGRDQRVERIPNPKDIKTYINKSKF